MSALLSIRYLTHLKDLAFIANDIGLMPLLVKAFNDAPALCKV
jgi:hypothetical protein